MNLKTFISADQWVQAAPRGGVYYYDGVHHGHADSLDDALLACQQRYDYARGIREREPGTHVYGSVKLPQHHV